MLDELSELPAAFGTVNSRHITDLFPHPTLIHLPGRREPAVFVSILLHGNEDVGLRAVQMLLDKYGDKPLPRGLSIFIGNVDACASSARYLPHQVDFNRVWPGTELPHTPTHDLMDLVTRRMFQRGVFVSIDLHNNTGRNPIYACVCDTAPEHIYLASMFSRTVVYFTRPRGVQTQAFSDHCPAITCECGQVGDMAGVERAAELLDACLHLNELPHHLLPEGDVHLFHTVARIRVRPECTFGFSPGSDIVLRDDLDCLNFIELQPGESLATLGRQLEECFVVNDQSGRDVTDHFLACTSQQLRLNRPAMPSMFTRNLDVIRQDCLGYLMERFPIEHLG